MTSRFTPARAAQALLPGIRLTVPALATLLALTILTPHHSDAYHLQQHYWRTEHQTRAAVAHYRRRGDPLPTRLRPWKHTDQKRSQLQDLLL